MSTSRFKVHELLKDKPEELAALEQFARDPGRTVDECLEWMQAQGYTLSRSAVGEWKRKFDAQILQERFSRSGELAHAIKGAVSSGDFEAVADAATMQLTQVIFEQAAKLEQDGDLDPLDVQRMTRSLANLVGSKQKLIEMLSQKFEKESSKLVSTAAKRQLTQQDLDEAKKAIFG